MSDAIEIQGLGKDYRRRGGRTVAVDGLDLSVPVGGVFGFCGPNGSGKTTTIRCLLGLVRKIGVANPTSTLEVSEWTPIWTPSRPHSTRGSTTC